MEDSIETDLQKRCNKGWHAKDTGLHVQVCPVVSSSNLGMAPWRQLYRFVKHIMKGQRRHSGTDQRWGDLNLVPETPSERKWHEARPSRILDDRDLDLDLRGG
eukprot:6480086-Amphidinium_carterae.2